MFSLQWSSALQNALSETQRRIGWAPPEEDVMEQPDSEEPETREPADGNDMPDSEAMDKDKSDSESMAKDKSEVQSLRSQIEDVDESPSLPNPNIPPLPRELIGMILRYMDRGSRVNSQRMSEDKEDMLSNRPARFTNLKNASLVSHAWRREALPLLFTHPRLFISEKDRALTALEPLLAFLTANNFASSVTSFVLFIDYSNTPKPRRDITAHVWTAFFAAIKPRTLIVTTPPSLLADFLGAPIKRNSYSRQLCDEHGSFLLMHKSIEVEETVRGVSGYRSVLPHWESRAGREPEDIFRDEEMVLRRLWYTDGGYCYDECD